MYSQSLKKYERAKNFHQDDENLRQYYPSQKDEKRGRSFTSSVSNKFKKLIDRGSKASRDAASPEKMEPNSHKKDQIFDIGKKYGKYEKRPKNDQDTKGGTETETFSPKKPPAKSRRTVTRIPNSSTFVNDEKLATKSDVASDEYVAELQAEVKSLKMKNSRMLAERNVAFDKAIDLDKDLEKWRREANFWRSEYYKEKSNTAANKDANTSEYHDCISMLISFDYVHELNL